LAYKAIQNLLICETSGMMFSLRLTGDWRKSFTFGRRTIDGEPWSSGYRLLSIVYGQRSLKLFRLSPV